MKRQFAIVSLLSTVLFLSACSSTGSNNHPQSAPKTNSSWQECAVVGGAVIGIPAAIGSLATGGIAAVVGALVSGIGCAVAEPTSSTVLFGFGAYELNMKDRLIIDKIIQDMGSTGRIKVVGYTCDIGTSEYNQTLSENRAEAVKEYLMDQGVDENRIITAGMGAKNPVAKNDSESNRKKNRRVEMIISR